MALNWLKPLLEVIRSNHFEPFVQLDIEPFYDK
jgi:hypothetical protein